MKEARPAIDDEPAMTEWLKILLEHADLPPHCFIGARGEELFKTWLPDAVITDMMLPDVDGIDLVRKFKQMDVEAAIRAEPSNDNNRGSPEPWGSTCSHKCPISSVARFPTVTRFGGTVGLRALLLELS